MANSLFKSIKNLTNSTESKVKNATSNESLGPYNHELIEISMLTFNKKQMSIVGTVLTKRLTGVLETIRSPKRAHTWSSANANRHDVSRAASFSSSERVYLQLLKTLSTILYLMQNGSDGFVSWVRAINAQLVTPLKYISLPRRFKESVRFKASSIVHYCEDADDLQHLRVNIHKLRSDLSIPGLKRSNTLDNMHDTVSPPEPVSPVSNTASSRSGSREPAHRFRGSNENRRIASLDVPRTYHNKESNMLTPLLEESRESLLRTPSSHSNNPFYRI